jgi:hypothetical protein
MERTALYAILPAGRRSGGSILRLAVQPIYWLLRLTRCRSATIHTWNAIYVLSVGGAFTDDYLPAAVAGRYIFAMHCHYSYCRIRSWFITVY